MSNEVVVHVGCALCIVFLATFLCFHPQYEDGVIRKLGLAALAFGEFFVAYDALIVGQPERVTHTFLIVQLGLTTFMCCHTYGFLRWYRCGSLEWRPAKK